MDSIDHGSKHVIAPCLNKGAIERTSHRKDLLKQHVLHVHLAGESASVKRNFKVPQEWSRWLETSPNGLESRWCGVCQIMLKSIAERMDHVAQHFGEGMDMSSWVRV